MRTAFPRIMIILLSIVGCSNDESSTGNTSVGTNDIGFEDQRRLSANATENLKVSEDLALQLFASEPMVINPTNMDIDEKGRVWVLEARNYRPDYNPHHPRNEDGDTVVILEDTDGDGKADSRKVFYQGSDVDAALGIMVIGNQVVVSSAPNVLLLSDTNGDDKADEKEYIFTGTSGIQDDHGLHAFIFGPDGKFYFNAGNGGKYFMHADGSPVRDPQGRAVDVREGYYHQGMAFRTNLDGSDFEVLGHNFRNNYELAVDAFGTVWQSDNDDDGNFAVRINYVMEYGNYGYRDELTGEGWRVPRTGIEDEIPERHWHLNDPGVVPNLLQTGAGSPTGILVYEGDLLPERFHGQMIHADAGPHVVRSYPVEKDGAGYTATIDDIVSEKSDKWFRPADVTVAPDGSLFIADWYDATVGGNQAVDNERGRIYRVAPKGSPYQVPTFNLDSAEAAVERLTSFHHTSRYLAYQRLLEMGDDAIPALESVWEHSSSSRDRARVLWLLSRMDASYILKGLKEDDSDIRVAAVRMARAYSPDLPQILSMVVEDASAQVRREAAIALRNMGTLDKGPLWTRLAEQHDGKDRWYLEALGIGAGEDWELVMQAWLGKVGEETALSTAAGRDIIWRSRSSMTATLLGKIISEQEGDKHRYYRSFDFLPEEFKGEKVLLDLLQADLGDEANRLSLKHLANQVNSTHPVVRAAIDQSIGSAEGDDYLQLLSQFQRKADPEILRKMTFVDLDADYRAKAAALLLDQNQEAEFETRLRDPQHVEDLSNLLGQVNNNKSRQILLASILDNKISLGDRRHMTSIFANSFEGQKQILAMLEEKTMPNELKDAAASKLLNAWPLEIRLAAEKILRVDTKKIPPIRSLMSIGGDPESGKGVFNALCQQCHMVDGAGTAFGPDLSLISDKLSKYALFEAILRPNAAITFGYEGVTIETNSGETVNGYLTSETAEELQIRVMGGQDKTIPVSDLKERRELEQSLMTPVGAGLERQSLVDLVAFLESLKS